METSAQIPLSQSDLIEKSIRRCLEALGLDLSDQPIHVERTARLELGDFFTNCAMVNAKNLGQQPRQLALRLAQQIEKESFPNLARVEVAGPGFINFFLEPSWLHQSLRRVIEQGEGTYARADIGGGERVQIEFVSANPTGPLHVGNGWLCSFGDTLSRLLDWCGWNVTKEYYVNDTGNQIRTLGMSLLAHCEGRAVPEGGYKGQYVAELAKKYLDESKSANSSLDLSDELVAGKWAGEKILANIRGSLSRLGIEFDVWFSQAEIEEGGATAQTIEYLSVKDLVYEKDGAIWLNSISLGDTRDRVLVKSNGDVTYLGGDIAYHRNKFLVRNFDRVIDIFGADHHGQVASLRCAIQALGVDPSRLEIYLGQMVSLADKKMSKRDGNFVSLDELLDDIGEDAFRFLSLAKSINESTTLDLDLVRSKSMDNPVYYVQYAHARIASIERVRQERGIDRSEIETVDLSCLVHPRELDLIRSIEELPEVIADCARLREPFKITNQSRKIADRFHSFYHDCHVIGESVPPELTQARLWLVESCRIALAISLGLLGVSLPDSM